MDWQAVGGALIALVVGAGSGMAWWDRRSARIARVSAEAAEATADRTRADAEHTLYSLLVKRLAEVEDEQKAMRAELDIQRRRAQELETHIFHLENLMRGAGLVVPERPRMLG